MNKKIRLCLFILLPIVLAVAGGAVWGLVDWLRNYGSGITPFPYLDHSATSFEFFNRYDQQSFLGLVERAINFYNLNFRGGTRFGSGLGFMAGAFVAMGFYKGRSLFARSFAGVIAGAEIGGRFALNLGSGVALFLVGLVIGAAIGGVYMGIATAPSSLQILPNKDLAKIS